MEDKKEKKRAAILSIKGEDEDGEDDGIGGLHPRAGEYGLV